VLTQLVKFVLLAALLSAFAASSAPVFSRGGDHDFCAFAFSGPTECFTRADGSCYTQKCDNPSFCSYSYCVKNSK
jgi:hypothetical protein